MVTQSPVTVLRNSGHQMSRAVMSAREVARLKEDGLYAVGGVTGLSVRVRDGLKRYVLRYTFAGKRQYLSIGDVDYMSLSEARELASKYRTRILAGEDVAATIRALKAAPAPEEKKQNVITFAAAAELWIADKAKHGGFANNARGEATARGYLTRNVLPVIGDKPINDIKATDVFEVLKPLWTTTTSAHQKVRDIVSAILNWSAARGWREVTNPAAISGPLGELLKQLGVHRKQSRHYPALDWREIPEFFEALHEERTMAARLLEFSILTASRSKAAREARWDQIDLEAGTWACPEAAMKVKGRGNFVVYLSTQALELLRSMPRTSELVFPSPYRGAVISDAGLGKVITVMHKTAVEAGGKGWIDVEQTQAAGEPVKVTQHGTARATFMTYFRTGDRRKEFDREALDLCLAHDVGGKIGQAYDHAKIEEERRAIMQAWGDWCWSRVRGAAAW